MPLPKLPPYLSEVKPEEHAFILLERTRWQWCQWVAVLYATPVFNTSYDRSWDASAMA